MPPVVARPAATVLLLRDCPHPPDGRAPLQVFLQRRVAGMAFAGGMTVFPGGGVDATDREDVPWTGPEAAWWGERLACAPEEARALVQAAVRETFEECGVLLTGDSPDGAWLAGAREDLVARRRSLGDLLRASSLQLRSDLLHPWARWITPEGLPRRYDTAFLVARVPDGQVADDRTTEAVEASWWHPADALAGAVAGELELMTPTQHTLQELADHADAGSVIAAAAERRIEPVTPRARRVGGQVVIVVPDGPGGALPTRQPR